MNKVSEKGYESVSSDQMESIRELIPILQHGVLSRHMLPQKYVAE